MDPAVAAVMSQFEVLTPDQKIAFKEALLASNDTPNVVEGEEGPDSVSSQEVVYKMRSVSLDTLETAKQKRYARNLYYIKSEVLNIDALVSVESKLRESTSTYMERNFRNVLANLVSDNIKLLTFLKKVTVSAAIHEAVDAVNDKVLMEDGLNNVVQIATEHVAELMAEEGVDIDAI
jgi:hypothetical protein